MKRVLFIAYHFPPVGGGGVQRSIGFVRYLPEFGYEPVVITGPGEAAGRWAPADETLVADVPGDVEIHRIQGPHPAPSAGWSYRVQRLLDLPTEYERWWVQSAIQLGGDARGIDIVFGELVPYDTAEIAMDVAAALGIPWVADLQDPWALDEMWLYPTGLHRRRDLRRMHRQLASAAAVIMNTPEAAKRVRRALPELGATPITSIPNGFDSADFAAQPPPRSDEKFRIVHSGYLHTEHGLRVREVRRLREFLGGAPIPGVDIYPRSHVYLLEAVKGLLAADPALKSVLEVHLAGVVNDVDRAIAADCPFVTFHGYLNHAENIELLRSADLLFLPMQDMPAGLRAGLVPGKTYEYLASGTAILAAIPDGDARDLLTEAGNAFLCRPRDWQAMAEIIRAQVARKERGLPPSLPRWDVVEQYERRHETAKLARVLDNALRTKRSPSATTATRVSDVG